MSDPNRYALENGKMVLRPHCGEYVLYDDVYSDKADPVIIKRMMELIESMKSELEDVSQPRTFNREVNDLREDLRASGYDA